MLSPVITLLYRYEMFILDEISFFLHFVLLYYDLLLMLNDLVYDLYMAKPIKQKSTF